MTKDSECSELKAATGTCEVNYPANRSSNRQQARDHEAIIPRDSTVSTVKQVDSHPPLVYTTSVPILSPQCTHPILPSNNPRTTTSTSGAFRSVRAATTFHGFHHITSHIHRMDSRITYYICIDERTKKISATGSCQKQACQR